MTRLPRSLQVWLAIFTCAAAMSIVFIVVIPLARRKLPSPTVGLTEYLASTQFEGIVLDAPLKNSSGRSFADLKPTGQQVKLRFGRLVRGRGVHTLRIGSNEYSGEWNVANDAVFLWIDRLNGKPLPGNVEPISLHFRAPRSQGDPISVDCGTDPPAGAKLRGIILARETLASSQHRGSDLQIDVTR